jgi:general secretion pathway protein D
MILMPTLPCRRSILISAALFISVLTPVSAYAFSADDCKKQKGVTLNFVNVEIREVITSISDCIGKNILIDTRVNGKVTILSKTPLRKESIYDVFLDVLRAHNYVAIEQGDVIKIIPLEEAKQNPTSSSHAVPGGAEQITRIVKIKNISAAQLVPVLRPLMPREAYLQAYMDTNTLVLSDSEKNIQRLLRMIDSMDKPNPDRDEIVPLYQANADEVLRILRETQPKKTETSGTVTADKRSNSIIISGNKAERERFARVIKRLDTPIANHAAHHVVALKYAKATDLAPILDKVINNKSGAVASGSSAPSGAVPGSNPAGQVTAAYVGGTGTGTTSIIADESTNSLIISADFQSYQAIQEILKQLDIPRKQVMIKAIIAEVSTDNVQKLGLQWGIAGNNSGIANTPQGGSGLLNTLLGNNATPESTTTTNALGVSTTTTASVSASGIASALLTGGFSSLISKGDISVMLSIIKNDANANILSAPQILTLDNKEAEMVVGENVPFVTGSYSTQSTGGSSVNPFTTVQRQDVGLILKVKPQINQGGMITMEISQETSAVKDTKNASGITTTKRSIKSNVSVADGNMLVLGGLMNDQINDGVDSVPILGDIPILGWLFKTQQTTSTKRTLMVFIQPTIVSSEETHNPATQKAISAIEEEQKNFNKKDLLLTPDPKRYQIAPQVEPVPELDATPKAAQ